jgi:hypothetical protein
VFPFPFPKKNMLTTTFISSFDRKEKRMFIKIKECCYFLRKISTRKRSVHENKIFDKSDSSWLSWESEWLLFVKCYFLLWNILEFLVRLTP